MLKRRDHPHSFWRAELEDRKAYRCLNVRQEHDGRRWRCQLVANHPGKHVSFTGHREWDDQPKKGTRTHEQGRLPL